MSLVTAYKGRGITRDITIQNVDGDTVTPGDSDVVRVSIGREGETPELTVTSTAATANGSSITKGAANRLRLDAADLDFDPGVYTMFVEMMDAADEDEWKNVDRQVFCLIET